MKKSMFVFAAAIAAVGVSAAAEPSEAEARLKAVADGVCTILSVKEMQTKGLTFTRVDYALRPEAESDIRCRILLPPAEKWNGEFWGTGNSSLGGSIPDNTRMLDQNMAVATTDLGTARYVNGDAHMKAGIKADLADVEKTLYKKGDCLDKPWPEAILKDYGWRATHLMTVYAKRFVKAFYGRAQKHSYFVGGSCGGRQALSEAMRFPEDYDGILSSIPSGTSIAHGAQNLHRYKMTHDDADRPLVTPEQLRIIADAPIEYMKDRDLKPYAGHLLSNPFAFTPEDIDGFLALAAKKDPALGEPSLKARLREMFLGYSRNGRVMCHGILPGVMSGNKIGISFRSKGTCVSLTHPQGRRKAPTPTWEQFDEAAERNGGVLNASSFDLAKFRDRGCKLIVTAALEDQSTPAANTIAWYEMMAEHMGGIEKVQDFCRLFVLPGVAHGGGKGHILRPPVRNQQYLDLLREWVAKGVAPTTLPLVWRQGGITFPLPPYPLMCYQDESGAWKNKRYPEGMIRRPDARYFRTDIDVER